MIFNKNIKFTPNTELAKIVGSYPVPSSKKIPEWYKKIDLYTDSNKLKLRHGLLNQTVKNCSPFLDAMIAGYTITLQDDLLIDWENGNPQLNWRTSREIISFHDLEQSLGMPVPDGYYSQVIKFDNDIIINVPEGYSVLITHPINRFDLPFHTITGMVDADKYLNPVKFPFFLKYGWEGILERGTPIAQIIPIKRDNWKSEIGEYDRERSIKESVKFFGTIYHSYKNGVWTKKTYQ